MMATNRITNEDTDPKLVGKAETHESAEDKSIIVAQDNPPMEGYMQDLAFLNEKVQVMLLESNDPHDTARLVTVGVNGKTFYFMKGEWRSCPRYVLEMLARAKKEVHSFGYKMNQDRTTSDTNTHYRALRYPHQFVDNNPIGQKWYNTIKDLHL